MRPFALPADVWSPSPTCANAVATGGTGIIALRSFACGASTSRKRIRCNRGRGISAARRCMNSIAEGMRGALCAVCCVLCAVCGVWCVVCGVKRMSKYNGEILW